MSRYTMCRRALSRDSFCNSVPAIRMKPPLQARNERESECRSAPAPLFAAASSRSSTLLNILMAAQVYTVLMG